MSAEGSGGVHVHQWPQALVDIPIGPCLVPSYPPWLGSLIKEIKPYHRTVQDSFRIRNVTHGTFTRAQAHDCLIQFYPLMETFPHWASLNVEKTSDCALRATLQRHVRAIKWQAHRWRQMAEGFGVSRQQLFETSIRMNVKVLNQYLWTVTHRQSLAESMMVLGICIGRCRTIDGAFTSQRDYTLRAAHEPDSHKKHPVMGPKSYTIDWQVYSRKSRDCLTPCVDSV